MTLIYFLQRFLHVHVHVLVLGERGTSERELGEREENSRRRLHFVGSVRRVIARGRPRHNPNHAREFIYPRQQPGRAGGD